ncbi:MAG: hypothetical protein KHY83_02120 [Coriobacteriia bacterium]|nr:hypothetical protein [Coriobacteriia bacterium]MBS5477449.1 hypothetical protein [Coriobacteriia bacterium]
MLVSSELVNRLLKKLCVRDPSLEADAHRMAELSRTALRNPASIAVDDEDRAFIALDKAIALARRELDDEADSPVPPAPAARLTRTRAQLNRCLALDPHCYDARLLLILADDTTQDVALEELLALSVEARSWCTERSRAYDGATVDAWDAVFLRPWLRIEGKIIDLLVASACYREALERCRVLLKASPADGQGIRHTAALILARLEDERGLDELDALFGRAGSTWMHLARAMLLYKLGRLDAARRAVIGLAELCPGAAYYLTYPSYVPPYLPDRPPFTPGSEYESLYATFEADFLVVDTPDFVPWANAVSAFASAAEKYGRLHGDDLE